MNQNQFQCHSLILKFNFLKKPMNVVYLLYKNRLFGSYGAKISAFVFDEKKGHIRRIDRGVPVKWRPTYDLKSRSLSKFLTYRRYFAKRQNIWIVSFHRTPHISNCVNLKSRSSQKFWQIKGILTEDLNVLFLMLFRRSGAQQSKNIGIWFDVN